jgi:predicted AlkP superfamily pyrophosphatase or phosphodiesterase
VEKRTAPTLAALHEAGTYRRADSTFPSLTPVCLATLATGAHPDVHHIPHLVWYSRAEERIVEYGSSFGAMRAAGTRRSIRDAIVEMNAVHLSRDAVTVFESLEDAGLTTAAVNTPCYRGRTRHLPTVPGLVRPVDGPRRFFYFSLFESDVTGAPLAIRTRTGGSIDAYAAAVGRWLVTRDGFDFLFYYLPDYDYASHARGPGAAQEALVRSDQAVGALVEAAGGLDELLERYAIVICSDHGQTPVARAVRLQDSLTDLSHTVVTASNRAGMVYLLPGATTDARSVAERLARTDGVDVALFREGDASFALRDGDETALTDEDDGWRGRAWRALANPNAGDVVLSAAPGVEFADLGGRHHAGGGSHGSLVEGDSLVPMLVVGGAEPPSEIAGVAPLVLDHFGVEAPAYARAA